MPREATLTVRINGEDANATYGELIKRAAILNNELKKLTPGTADFERKSRELRNVRTRLNTVRDGVRGTTVAMAKATQSAGIFQRSLIGIGTVLKASGILFLVDRLINIGRQMVGVTSKFEKFQAVLENSFGDPDLARASLDVIQEFVSRTPFQIDEVTESFVKLVNRGFVPTKEELTTIGDLAASQGKSFDQLVEAILDAQTGEFERLKEFGIRAKAAGDQVQLSFKGQTVEVEKTDDAIRQAILSFGEMEGVAGGMEKISATLGGQLSNLADNFTNLLRTIGDSGVGGALTKLVAGINQVIGGLVNFISTGSRTTVAGQILADVMGFLGRSVGNLLSPFRAVVQFIRDNALGAFSRFANGVVDTYNRVAGAVNSFAEFITRATGGMTNLGNIRLPEIDLDAYRQRAEEARRVAAEEAAKTEQDVARAAEEARAKAAAAARERERQERAKEAQSQAASQKKDELNELTEQLLARNEQERKATDAFLQMQQEEIDAIVEKGLAQQQADLDYEAKRSEIMERIRQAGMTDREQELAAISEYYQRLYELAEFYGLDVTALREEEARQRMEIAQREADFEESIRRTKLDSYADLSASLSDFLSADEKARRKHADAIKAFEVGSILANLYAEIQGYFKANSSLGPAGVVLSKIQAAAATVRAFAAVRRVTSQKFAEGGFTGEGTVADSTGERVAGVVHANEWVAPRWMNESPATAPIIRALEGIRQRGFAEGGFTTPNTTPNAQALNAAVNQADTGRLGDTLNRLDQALRMMPRRLRAEVVYQDIEDAGAELGTIRELASL